MFEPRIEINIHMPLYKFIHGIQISIPTLRFCLLPKNYLIGKYLFVENCLNLDLYLFKKKQKKLNYCLNKSQIFFGWLCAQNS